MKNSYYGPASYHIYCYFGDTHDVFLDETLAPMTMPEMLHRDLKLHGYERIVFFDYNDGGYFLDARSRQLMQGKKEKPVVPKLGQGKGKLLLPAAPVSQPQTNESKKPELSFTVDPTEMLHYTGRFLEDGSIRTAVIIPDALNLLNHMHESVDQGSMLNDLFKKVANINQLTNRNVLILGFNRSEQQVVEFFHGHSWDYVWKAMSKLAVFHAIAAPSPEEIRYALHHLRLVGVEGKRLRVDVSRLDQITEMLAGKIRRNISSPDAGIAYIPGLELSARTMSGLLRHLQDHLIAPEKVLDLQTCQALCAQSSEASAWQRLEKLIGMQELKDTLRAYIDQHQSSGKKNNPFPLRLEPPVAEGKEEGHNLHFVLTGRKGTGKSTAAKLIGQILAESGLLPSGHLVETDPTQLIGEYVGQSEAKIRDALARARGGVLFIDEAYGFRNKNGFNEGMVNALVAHMTAHKGEYSVILAGYRDEMEQMMKDVNPGLKERFQNHIHIADYTPEELARIFRLMAGQQGKKLTPELDGKLVSFFDNWYADCQNDWANGRMVENLLKDKSLFGIDLVECAHVPLALQKYLSDREQRTVREQLDAMVGLAQVKEQVEEFENQLLYRKKKQKKQNYHFVFAGNPGTGKTTVAKLFGQLLKGAGVLKSGLVNEVEAEELMKGTLDEWIKKSRDRVLFIDEAYQLRSAPAVIDQLVQKTNPEAVELPFCMICAGYEGDMAAFMGENKGMHRRFTVIHFADYTVSELMRILEMVCREQYGEYAVTEEFLTGTRCHFETYHPQIAAQYNGGYIGRYLKKAQSLLFRKFKESYPDPENDPPPDEAYVFDGAVLPEEFCG